MRRCAVIAPSVLPPPRPYHHPQARGELVQGCIDILHVYRKKCASATSSGQLILPESLKLLPLYTLSLLKVTI